jgi:hypothetical protein
MLPVIVADDSSRCCPLQPLVYWRVVNPLDVRVYVQIDLCV